MSDENWLQTLTKSSKDKWIGGVCGGLGEHSPVPSWYWRLFFAILFMLCGTGYWIDALCSPMDLSPKRSRIDTTHGSGLISFIILMAFIFLAF